MSQPRPVNPEFWTAGGLNPADLAVVRQALGEPAARYVDSQLPPPSLVVLCGLPGTGKSYFAQKLTARAPFIWVNSDRTRKSLISAPRYTRGEHRRVFAVMHAITRELLAAGRSVVFDATNLNEAVRLPLYEVAAEAGVEPILVRFTAEPQLVRRRLLDRSHGVGDAAESDADWRIYSRMVVADQPVPRPHLLVSRPEQAAPVLEQVLRRTGWASESAT